MKFDLSTGLQYWVVSKKTRWLTPCPSTRSKDKSWLKPKPKEQVKGRGGPRHNAEPWVPLLCSFFSFVCAMGCWRWPVYIFDLFPQIFEECGFLGFFVCQSFMRISDHGRRPSSTHGTCANGEEFARSWSLQVPVCSAGGEIWWAYPVESPN